MNQSVASVRRRASGSSRLKRDRNRSRRSAARGRVIWTTCSRPSATRSAPAVSALRSTRLDARRVCSVCSVRVYLHMPDVCTGVDQQHLALPIHGASQRRRCGSPVSLPTLSIRPFHLMTPEWCARRRLPGGLRHTAGAVRHPDVRARGGARSVLGPRAGAYLPARRAALLR